MGMGRRTAGWLGLGLLGFGGPACDGSPTPPSPVVGASVEAPAETDPSTAEAVARDAFVLARDGSGRPSLVLGLTTGPAPTSEPIEAARSHLRRLAGVFGATISDADGLATIGTTPLGPRGASLVAFDARIDGVELLDGPVLVAVTAEGRLVAMRGGPTASIESRLGHFALPPDQVAHRLGTERASSAPVTIEPRGADARGSWRFVVHRASSAVSHLRIRPAWEREDLGLVPVYVVEELPLGATFEPRRLHVDARDGRMLASRSLVDRDAFTYRVFADPLDGRPFDGPTVDVTPHPTGAPGIPAPAYVLPNDVSVDAFVRPDGTFDSWLPPDATETTGLHVEAYADRYDPDGFTEGDVRPVTTSPRVFGRAYDPTAEPLASDDQSMASATALFYVSSYLHDYFYASGFDEIAGNAQRTNFGRGGAEGDPIIAEAQDAADRGVRDNAYMFTPEDGFSPGMHVFLWTAEILRELELGGRLLAPGPSIAYFGPTAYDVRGDVAIADDGVDVGSDACSPLLDDLTGRVALVDRGTCTFREKTAFVQQAGGIGVLIANNQEDEPPPNMAVGDAMTPPIAIPAMGIRYDQGRELRSRLASGSVEAFLHRIVDTERDGSLDHLVVAHEWGHYLNRRLTICDTHTCSALAEGYCDFLAMHLAIRPGDDLAGAYAMGSYASRTSKEDATYFGLRRVPYSIDPSKNALSFRHVTKDEPLPETHPLRPGGANEEVHNAGEIWASMLFEAYAALRSRPGLGGEEGRRRMADILVAGMRLSPRDSTHTEARDALLAAAHAIDPGDASAMAEAFARRGAGTCAVSAPRTTADFVGVVESTSLASRIAISPPVVVADGDVCDTDGILDSGESGHVEVRVANGGPVASGPVTVRLSSTTDGFELAGAAIVIESIPSYGATSVRFPALLDPRSGVREVKLVARVETTTGCPESATSSATEPVNVDDAVSSGGSPDADAGAACPPPTFPDTDGGFVDDVAGSGVVGGGLGCSVAPSPGARSGRPPHPLLALGLALLGLGRRRRAGASCARGR